MGTVTTPEGSTAAPGLSFGTLLSRFAAAGALAGALSAVWLLLVTERTIEPALAIEEALAAEANEPLLVRGNLLAERDEIRLCSALAESFPPQCGGASLRVEGLDLERVGGLTSAGDVAWSDRPVELRGVVEDGVLRVSG